ncbi:putative lyase [Limihaloglobus sulfuriphilus]|uniref:Putative lyase n=1 Tax=Limihaloglobus sulfuriphilus TaxID=1851148 RepID=A0A1Q2MFV1_9BACT|nr:VOC family protein [Limihaloglobus sulfuriphilus]AQQ71529.1 putative lyase [Limihaloglobus sulfuriphilus]
MIKNLAHICITTADLAATENFYCSVLGLKKHFSFMRDNEECGFYIAVGENSYIEFFSQSPEMASKPKESSVFQHICLETDEIDAVISRLKTEDIDVTEKMLGADNSWQCWLEDPNGLKIEIHQYTAQSTQITGADCELK